MEKRRIRTRKKYMKKRKQDFFTYLPSEIIMEILSRLQAQTILCCKCVCTSWYNLVETHEFAKFHLSKSVPGLALTIMPNVINKTVELTNMLDVQHNNLQDLHFSTITKLSFTYPTFINGSTDGLLLLNKLKSRTSEIYLCNPITRECIDLQSPIRPLDLKYPGRIIIYGFGVSKLTGQYKVVRILHCPIDSKTYRRFGRPESDCKVYTIGTRYWRTIAPHAPLRYQYNNNGAFVNGNLHWFVLDLNGTPSISCFDLETELFTTFSPPPVQDATRSIDVVLLVLEGCLCLCDCTSSDGRVIIWLMKEYGVTESWVNVIVIGSSPDINSILVYPIRISKDGVILMPSSKKSLFYYSRENNTIQRICNSIKHVYLTSVSNTPSFVSLKSFKMENSFSF